MAAVGWIGLGKLGGPCSAALAFGGGHDVMGYDVALTPEQVPTGGLPPLSRLGATVRDVVEHTDDIVYVAVQTPHVPDFGGEYPLMTDAGELDREPVEFEYGFLTNAVAEVAAAARELSKDITIVIVSTVLPGACNRYIRPLLNSHTRLVYHPFFIAMGTVIEDFVTPEFALLGADRPEDARRVIELYRERMHDRPAYVCSVESAELAKVAYNTFITMKIVFANALGEMAEATGADVDEVIDALALGTDRIISPRYMRAGMGDGGACHPRDNIALAALAIKHNLSVNLMGYLVMARESQTARQAQLAVHWKELTGYGLVILGKTYKPGVASTAGSPAMLLANMLDERKIPFTHIDHMTDDERFAADFDFDEERPYVFFVATQHERYATQKFPRGSVIIDPFGYVQAQDGVTLITPGRKRRNPITV